MGKNFILRITICFSLLVITSLLLFRLIQTAKNKSYAICPCCCSHTYSSPYGGNYSNYSNYGGNYSNYSNYGSPYHSPYGSPSYHSPYGSPTYHSPYGSPVYHSPYGSPANGSTPGGHHGEPRNGGGGSSVTTYTITGSVNTDYDHNANTSPSDSDDVSYTGNSSIFSRFGGNPTLTLLQNGNALATTTPNQFGSFYFDSLQADTYTISMSNTPSGYEQTPGTGDITVVAGPNNPTANFYLTPLYNISGLLYNDVNQSTYYTAGVDQIYSAGSLSVTGPTTVNNPQINSDGTYTLSGLLSGTYSITYTPVGNFKVLYPGSPATFIVSVGDPTAQVAGGLKCNAGNYHATDDVNNPGVHTFSSCVNDPQNNIANSDVSGLNIAVSNEYVWYQSYCADIRDDNGINDNLPAAGTTNPGSCGAVSNQYVSLALNGDPNTAGILYSGDQFYNFGNGQASVNGYIVGGTAYSENFTPVNPTVYRTTYSYMTTTLKQQGITPTDLKTVCPVLSNCALPSNLSEGIYQAASSDVTLNGYTFPSGKNYVFLINGALTIKGNLLTLGNGTLTISTTGNILVDSSVGEQSITSLNADLMGYFTTDGSFVLNTVASSGGNPCNLNATSKDNKLNIYGAVIAKGGISDQRDLCIGDLTCPTYTINSGFCGNVSGSSVTGQPSGGICQYDKDCSGGLVCNTTANNGFSIDRFGLGSSSSCTCGAGSGTGTCTPSIGACVYDIDCSGGLVCNTSGSSCTCGTGSGTGTCTLGNGGAGGANTGIGISGNGFLNLLNLPAFVKHQNTIWQEVVPGGPDEVYIPQPPASTPIQSGPTLVSTATPTAMPTPTQTPVIQHEEHHNILLNK